MKEKDGLMISDKRYILDICDEVLGISSSRQHKFDFLLKSSDKSGNRDKLPVDAYYKDLNLVVEYEENQDTGSMTLFDKVNKMTTSRSNKSKEEKMNNKRKREVLSKYEIKLLAISYLDFKYDSKKRIIKNKNKDKEILKKKFNTLF